jgi:hypothetical protein
MTRKPLLRADVQLAIAILLLLIGAALTVIGVRIGVRPLATALLGVDMVRSGLFEFALVSLTLLVYLFVIVCAVRIWEESLRNLLQKLRAKQQPNR